MIIYLSNYPNVNINPQDWPIVAEQEEHTIEKRQTIKRQVCVRQHADQRFIVYATCAFNIDYVDFKRNFVNFAGYLCSKDEQNNMYQIINKTISDMKSHTCVEDDLLAWSLNEKNYDDLQWNLLTKKLLMNLPVIELI